MLQIAYAVPHDPRVLAAHVADAVGGNAVHGCGCGCAAVGDRGLRARVGAQARGGAQ